MKVLVLTQCVVCLLASPAMAGDECHPRSFKFDSTADDCITAYLTKERHGQPNGEFHPEFTIDDWVRVKERCMQETYYQCIQEDPFRGMNSIILRPAGDWPLISGGPLEGPCGGCTYTASYALPDEGLVVACERVHPVHGNRAASSARLDFDPNNPSDLINYQLDAGAMPTRIFTDYTARIVHDLESSCAVDENNRIEFSKAEANSSSGFEDQVFWHADVPFQIQQDVGITLVLHAWRDDPDLLLEGEGDGCWGGIETKEKYESTVWGGCAVYDSKGNPVAGLDPYAAWGQPVIELHGLDLVSDRLSPRDVSGDEVDLPQGDYVLRSWFHSDTDATVLSYRNETHNVLETAEHYFEVSLYIHNADISGPNGEPDGIVDTYDFSQLLVDYGTNVNDDDRDDHEEIPGDINHDGVVDLTDFSLLLVQFGS